VRNSGAEVVVEGVGDHGCEYMTGGRVVVLGPVGRNFGAGMSGGIAYLWDADARWRSRVNREMVELEDLADAADAAELRALVEAHARLTGSLRARRILDTWAEQVRHFVKVMPLDYKRALAEMAAESAVAQEATRTAGAAAAAVAA
jgi:glutamate synthase domain-containing protein 3